MIESDSPSGMFAGVATSGELLPLPQVDDT